MTTSRVHGNVSEAIKVHEQQYVNSSFINLTFDIDTQPQIKRTNMLFSTGKMTKLLNPDENVFKK